LGSHYQQAAHLIDRAIRISKATRSVTCIIVPDDVAEAEHEDPPRAHGAVFSEIGFPNLPRVVPQEEAAKASPG
jgi:pyruvate dehydrogenase (quinone)